MIDIKLFKNVFVKALDETFGSRVWFVGLQGSFAREEATNKSDIDLVVILDELSFSDITVYNKMLNTLPHRDKLCGFLSGKDQLLDWDSSDLFQFYYDTIPIKGSLDILLPLIDNSSVNKAIKTGVCNIYHGCIHNILYEKSEENLRSLYKSASFVIQAIHFNETGNYITHQCELIDLVSNENRIIINTFLNLKNNGDVNFDEMSEKLFSWSGKLIKKY